MPILMSQLLAHETRFCSMGCSMRYNLNEMSIECMGFMPHAALSLLSATLSAQYARKYALQGARLWVPRGPFQACTTLMPI
jgi:hypothetical protein